MLSLAVWVFYLTLYTAQPVPTGVTWLRRLIIVTDMRTSGQAHAPSPLYIVLHEVLSSCTLHEVEWSDN
jgi:hypothetical protein